MHDELNVNGHILHDHTFVSYLCVLFSFILFFLPQVLGLKCWQSEMDISGADPCGRSSKYMLVFPPVVLKSKSISLHLCDDSSNDTNTTFSVCN